MAFSTQFNGSVVSCCPRLQHAISSHRISCTGRFLCKKDHSVDKKGKNAKQRDSSVSTSMGISSEMLTALRRYSADEKLLFSPVPARFPDALQVIYAFPNEYAVGICSLGFQIIWRQLAEADDIHVARLFTDASEPLMVDPDLIGFSLSWELDYANILAMLDNLDVPARAEHRTDSDPFVFGGGSTLTANPEPYADFFDVILLGDGENLLQDFLDAVRASRGVKASRTERLHALAGVPGVYVPSAYRVEYESVDGPIRSIQPVSDQIPALVKKQTYKGQQLATSSIVSSRMAWENIFMVEVVRSCPEMCRFCLASYASLPFRSAPVDAHLIPAIERGLQYTDRIGLLGASVTQHPEFDKLLTFLLRPELAHVRMSIASVRTNTVTEKLATALASRGTKSLTMAVESGSARVRKIINKKLDDEEIIVAARNAQSGGLEKLKLYGMVGLPGETDDDVECTVEMVRKLRKAAPKLKFTLGCSTFVPKAHTPFQWYGISPAGEKRLQGLESKVRQLGVDFRPESYKWSVIQALLSRGDRRLSRLLQLVRTFGDSKGSFRRAFKEMKGQLPPMEFYTQRNVPIGEEMLPWSHLLGPLPESTLMKHAQDAASHFSDTNKELNSMHGHELH